MSITEVNASPAFWFLDDVVLVHVRGADTENRYDLTEFWAPPGDQPPPHVHMLGDEAFYVTEGEVTLFLPDREIVMRRGEFFNAPRDVPHTYRVTSSEDARWLVTASPGGVAAFVEDYGHPAGEMRLPDHQPPDVKRLGAAAEQRGMELLGPPGMLPADLPPSILAAHTGHRS